MALILTLIIYDFCEPEEARPEGLQVLLVHGFPSCQPQLRGAPPASSSSSALEDEHHLRWEDGTSRVQNRRTAVHYCCTNAVRAQHLPRPKVVRALPLYGLSWTDCGASPPRSSPVWKRIPICWIHARRFWRGCACRGSGECTIRIARGPQPRRHLRWPAHRECAYGGPVDDLSFVAVLRTTWTRMGAGFDPTNRPLALRDIVTYVDQAVGRFGMSGLVWPRHWCVSLAVMGNSRETYIPVSAPDMERRRCYRWEERERLQACVSANPDRHDTLGFAQAVPVLLRPHARTRASLYEPQIHVFNAATFFARCAARLVSTPIHPRMQLFLRIPHCHFSAPKSALPFPNWDVT
uniref:Uncharacterized protein n=1 Tax=Mycena chlorophos TaxID=658473 RepID=A0ABQ0LGV5_MYCCL|nr:predicted protein [Mycena chlorophos]